MAQAALESLPRRVSSENVAAVIAGLKDLYARKLKPLERLYKFNVFSSPAMTDSDFEAKPMVTLLGQYSTGKTTFISHILGRSYPGAHIGPEPTTDRFVAVMGGSVDKTVPGNTVSVHANTPFGGLKRFGTAFLSKFECAQMSHPLLNDVTFIDTPGVLSDTERSYDFLGVTEWFAAKSDMIFLLFDPHKLDISDELKRVIESLRGNDDKIRVLLNKVDGIDAQQLMRVYGALMWSLGKVVNTPEVMRVYIGSFYDNPQKIILSKDLFDLEKKDLLRELSELPKRSCDRRISEFVKRAHAAKVHAYLIGHLKQQMPILWGKADAQESLVVNLEDEFVKVQSLYHLPKGDLPNIDTFRRVLAVHNIDSFHRLRPSMIQSVDDMLTHDIPKLLSNYAVA
ncbi:EH domain-containing protein 1 [Selaginella moellendorffii]|uniref:EH domain-containing protein 1 n=1 Tax=Selaginella moellendorffii TaxID=88036 RepID=UPI000D1C3F37|nr:EH domain-containing protein 1 [Selaginella moellendorffii]|eukprot:XP_002978188.2 EH domain-containing protein 1 [Selaginella moellendorffii]